MTAYIIVPCNDKRIEKALDRKFYLTEKEANNRKQEHWFERTEYITPGCRDLKPGEVKYTVVPVKIEKQLSKEELFWKEKLGK